MKKMDSVQGTYEAALLPLPPIIIQTKLWNSTIWTLPIMRGMPSSRDPWTSATIALTVQILLCRLCRLRHNCRQPQLAAGPDTTWPLPIPNGWGWMRARGSMPTSIGHPIAMTQDICHLLPWSGKWPPTLASHLHPTRRSIPKPCAPPGHSHKVEVRARVEPLSARTSSLTRLSSISPSRSWIRECKICPETRL